MLNKVTLIGNVGQDPDIRSTDSGKEIATLSLATSERWKDKSSGEKKEKTEWHRIVVFNEGLVKIVKSYVKKGSRLYIEGALATRKWTDKDGVERYTTEILLNFGATLHLLDKKDSTDRPPPASSDSYGGDTRPPATHGNNNMMDDEIPF